MKKTCNFNAVAIRIKNSIVNLLIFPGLMLICGANINAFEIYYDVDIRVITQYYDCQPIADRILELLHKSVETKDESHKTHYKKRVKKKKKKLKKCEKRCDEDNFNNIVAYLEGGRIGFTHSF
jgi:hypothetical protein